MTLHFFTSLVRSKKTGFSLIEVVIGIAVITLIITAAAEITRSSIRMGSITSNELIANHLAEEGLEIVRNIRDSNWLRNQRWDTGLEDGDYTIEETSEENVPPFKLTRKEESALALLASESGNNYVRTIHIAHKQVVVSQANATDDEVTSDVITIDSTVTYPSRPERKSMTLSTTLTDWKQGPL